MAGSYPTAAQLQCRLHSKVLASADCRNAGSGSSRVRAADACGL